MSLINYIDIEDGDDANANVLNTRFAQIIKEINGNIDSQNIKNGSVTTPKIANGAVTSEKLDVARYIDDNGWQVADYGAFKTYQREILVTNRVIPGGGTRATVGDFAPPVGRVRESLVYQTSWYGGYAGHAITGCESWSGGLITAQLSHNWGASLTFNGRMSVVALEKLT